ncbi:hypothetical protein [Pseudolabrys sp.]|uniref:hypothetical protein n=1 Tax=Pseudolabrys sp. TaxID=1960880 RepID=UPI003D11D8F5
MKQSAAVIIECLDDWIDWVQSIRMYEFDKIEWEDINRRAQRRLGKKFSNEDFDREWRDFLKDRNQYYKKKTMN